MKVNSFIIKLVVLIMFIIMGSSCLVGFTQTSLSSSYGKQKILEIKSRNSSSEPLSVEALKRRIHQKDNVTQTTPEVKKKPTNKTIINKPQTMEMVVSDSRYFNIYDSTKKDKKVIGKLKAYSKVKVLKVVGDYYKIDKGYINKKALLSQQEFDKYTKRRGELTAGLTKKSNASIDDIKVITERYTRLKGMELTFLICEEEYGIKTNLNISLEERREIIMAKKRGQGTCTREMIKNVCEAFSGGEVNVIENSGPYKFTIQFVGVKGIPKNMPGLINTINEIKPAHLIYDFKYTYTSWNVLDNKKLSWNNASALTWEELEIYE